MQCGKRAWEHELRCWGGFEGLKWWLGAVVVRCLEQWTIGKQFFGKAGDWRIEIEICLNEKQEVSRIRVSFRLRRHVRRPSRKAEETCWKMCKFCRSGRSPYEICAKCLSQGGVLYFNCCCRNTLVSQAKALCCQVGWALRVQSPLVGSYFFRLRCLQLAESLFQRSHAFRVLLLKVVSWERWST